MHPMPPQVTSNIPGILWEPIDHHFSPRYMKVEGIVVHLEAGHGDLRTWFENPPSQVSSTYQVRQSGSIAQFLSESVCAWHAGVEAMYLDPKYAGPHKPKWPFIKPFINPNNYLLGIENEGVVTDIWPAAQIDSLTSLMADIAYRYGFPIDAGHVVKHCDIWDEHSCPGDLCPWEEIMSTAANKLASLKVTHV